MESSVSLLNAHQYKSYWGILTKSLSMPITWLNNQSWNNEELISCM